MTYKIEGPELAGFDLAATIVGGKFLMCGTSRIVDAPPEIELCGNTYTFEYIDINGEITYHHSVDSEFLERNEGEFCNIGYV